MKKILIIGILGILLFSSINAVGISIRKDTKDISTLQARSYDFGGIRVRTIDGEGGQQRNVKIELTINDNFDIYVGSSGSQITVEVDYDIDICWDLCNWVDISIELVGIDDITKTASKTVNDDETGELRFSFTLEPYTAFRVKLYAKYFYEPPLYDPYHKSDKEYCYGGSCDVIDINVGSIKIYNQPPLATIQLIFNNSLPDKLDVGPHGAFLMIHATISNHMYSKISSSQWAGITLRRKFHPEENSYTVTKRGINNPPSGTVIRHGFFFRPDEVISIDLAGNEKGWWNMGRSDYVAIHLVWDEGNSKPTITVKDAPTKVKPDEKFDIKIKVDDLDGHRYYLTYRGPYTDWREWLGPFEYGPEYVKSFSISNDYFKINYMYDIKIKVRDEYGLESDVETITVKVGLISSSKGYYSLISNFLEHFHFLQRLLLL